MIEKYLKNINHPLDLNELIIQILPFETDNDLERYKIVRRCIDDFIGDLNLNIPGLGKKIWTFGTKIYCGKVRRNPNQGKRSEYNTDKTKLLRGSLFKLFENEPNVSFCYYEDIIKENDDVTI